MIGELAPQFMLVDLYGKTVDLSQLRGQLVLIDFWASWCAPCVAGLPKLQDFEARSRGKGVTIIGVALDNADSKNSHVEKKLRSFVATHNVAFPVVELSPEFNRDYGAVLGLVGGRVVRTDGLIAASLPSWIVIDRAGIIKAVYTSSSEEQVLAEVADLAQ
jgi:thiol-disulfide isomerase/thioredoxin